MQTAILQKWDYLVEESSNLTALRDILKARGGEGWELVNVVGGTAGDNDPPAKTLRVRRSDLLTAIFKRARD